MVRPSQAGGGRRKPAPSAASAHYPPGYFTALMRRHAWPCAGWQPQRTDLMDAAARAARNSAQSTRAVDGGLIQTQIIDPVKGGAMDALRMTWNADTRAALRMGTRR